MSLLITVILTGLGGAFTPCTLGVNLVMINQLAGKPRLQRLREWGQFAFGRAIFLAALGLIIGLLGQAVETFTWWFQLVINVLIIVMGILFILSRQNQVCFLL